MPTDQELLQSGVDPAAVATLQQDRSALAERENTAALDAIAPIISPEEAASAEMDKLAPKISSAEAEKAQLDAVAPVVDPLDIFDDATLSKDLSFDPKEHYIQKGGAAAFDAKTAARLGRIRKGQEANRSVLGTAAAQLGNIIPQVPKVIAGVAKGIASGLNVYTAPAVAAVTPNELGVEYAKLTEQRAAEDVHGLVAETAGLAKGVGSLGKFLARKVGLSKDWKDMSDEEAFRAIIDEGEKERELRGMSQGDIPALAPTRERLAEEGVPVRPEKVQEATEHGLVGWLGFGTGIKLGGAAVKAGAESAVGAARSAGLLSGVEQAAQLQTLRAARDAALKVQQAGPKNAATEAALRTAQENFQAAETALSGAGKVADVAGRAATSVSDAAGTAAQNVIGRPIQAVGATAEGVAKLVTKVPRIYTSLGAIGGLFVHPVAAIGGLIGKEVVAPLVQKAGAAVKGYGKAIAEGEARRTLDLLGAVKDTAAGGLSQFPMDYAFSVGLSDTEQEARAAAPIATALGVIPGAGRGVRRVVTGELVTPASKPVKFKSSPAYGENAVLDAAHATAIKSTDAKTTAQINWVRELARKMGGRVYLMPDTQTFETTLTEVWKQQHAGAEPTPEVLASIKQAADQQAMAWGEYRGADGELQPTVFIKNPESVTHELGHILEKVLPEEINTKLDEQILNRLSDDNLEAAGKYYVNRALGQPHDAPVDWRAALTKFNPDLTPEQFIAREMRAENLGVVLKNRGEAFATSPGIYRWLAQTVAKIGDLQGIPLAQSADLGFPVFGDVMRAGEKAAGKIFGDEAGQELVQARERRLKVVPATKPAGETLPAGDRTAEGEKATAVAEEIAARDPAQAEVMRKVASAISGSIGLKVDYRSAPGEPGGSPNMSREARRAVIEAFRSMPEEVRPLWEKLNFPDRVEATKNRGFQILGWSSENFAANAQKMARFISEAPEAKSLSPYEVDPATKSFTPDAWKQIYEDTQVFVANQAAGGTGSGKPLTLPADAAAMRITVPPLREAALAPLDQTKADFINVLFNIMLPETPRVSRKGGTPGNIVAQRIAKANEPVVGPRVTRPGRVRSEAEFKGFPGESIQEVNPLRARMEQAASDAGVSFPSLIETSQRLNLDHIADVTPAPEAPVIRGVTDTLRAGFAPAEEKTVEKLGREIASMDVATFKAASEQWNGGMTGEAQRIGKLASSPEDLSSLQRLATEAQQRMNDAKKARDMDAVFAELAKKQFFDEAAQAASGRQFTTEAPTPESAPKESPQPVKKYNRDAVAAMTPEQLAEHFPEALPVEYNDAGNPKYIPSKILNSPLYKQAVEAGGEGGPHARAIKAFKEKLVEFYNEIKDLPEAKAGERWYEEFTPLLKKEFGDDAPVFAELLSATSPNTTPDVNFQFAYDALRSWRAGKFDKIIEKTQEGLDGLVSGKTKDAYEKAVELGEVKPPKKPTPATYLAYWIGKHDLVPKSTNGKRYGMHSDAVLKVIMRRWLKQTQGPKTQNFIENLLGVSHDATIDVWADRTMRRLGYSDFQKRWRILSVNKGPVTDPEFVFSQDAFREAAKEIGIKPSALQGALWFAEKKLWFDRGWGLMDLGDYRKEIEKVPKLKARYEERTAKQKELESAQKSAIVKEKVKK